MAQHGYLHDSYDRDDFGRGSDDDRDRSWRDRDEERGWRGRDEDRGWRGQGSDWSERDRDRGSMFGWRDHDRHSGDRDWRDRHGEDRGFFERAGDEMSSWFGGDRDHDRNRSRGEWQDRSRSSGGQSSGQYGGSYERGYGRSASQQQGFGGSGEWDQRGRRYSAHPDDHYRSWRDKQMEALDRDYQDYCREREQQFHQDFDSWRQNRQSQGQSQQAGSSGQTMELDQRANHSGEVPGATTSPMGAATMGTNNSENTDSAPTATGRKR